MILGDSLMVMTSLAEKERLKGQVQMIYIDPPYGIKFGSNWQVSTRKRDVKDGKAEDATRQPEQIKAFRDTWELGIHSYLSYMRDRLVVARELLSESGSVFVQIGDDNVHLLRCILDEIFGSDNFISTITVRKTGAVSSPDAKVNTLGTVCDHILWYSKESVKAKYRQLFSDKLDGGKAFEQYNLIFSQNNEIERLTSDQILSMAETELCCIFQSTSLESNGYADSFHFPVSFRGHVYFPASTRHWSTTNKGISHLIQSARVISTEKKLRYVRYLNDFRVTPLVNIWNDLMGTSDLIYVVQTNIEVIKRCMLMTTDPGDLVLDPTCGSGTTAYVAEQWGRRWITIDTSRVAIALARTRLMAARYPFYTLSDSPEGMRLEGELSGNPQAMMAVNTNADIRRGFVYKRVPHVTLKSIANNEDIDVIHAKWQTQLEPLRARINKSLKQNWEDWEIPQEFPSPASEGKTGDEGKNLLAEWWQLRRERQKEIDASIAKRADTELLYDQPYEDNKRIRVTGPFTVESLSPHRVLAAEAERPATEAAGQAETAQSFVPMILENLKAAGVQNTVKNERLKFERLEPFAGAWIQAAGEYLENGKTKRVAVSIGPENGTVGKEQIKEAAKEAVQGIGFDLLIVCGFAFDPLVSEEAKRYGNLAVLITRMNPDLSMGNELLKKTGAANLFMVFGEPDIKVDTLKDGRLKVKVRGVDVYDPTTGQIRSSTTDEIACWFIDTDYNGESFFVRHAYFTGAQEPYEKLQRALRAEIDEAAWSALYATESIPFAPPSRGKIAVKAINHYGDEVMKVYEVK